MQSISGSQPREIQNYLTAEGRSPFEEWLDALRILQPELESEIGLSESSQAIWETIAQLEKESVNLKLTMVQGIGSILGK
jgi:hypothetical protein